jgi:hypothetical protein
MELLELFGTMVLLMVAMHFIGPLYVNGVHRLGAWIVRKAPLRLVKVLALRLWRTHWDMARQVDHIGLQTEDRLRKRTPR